MRILGLCHDVFICSAAIVDDGRVVTAIPEERLSRRKQDRVFPEKAIEACLAEAGLALGDLDEIAVAWNPAVDAETTPPGHLQGRTWRAQHLMTVPARLMRLAGGHAGTTLTLHDLWEGAPPVTYVDHYAAHIANGVYLSPFDECAVAVLDGRAERKTGLLGTVRGTDLGVLSVTDYPHSLGLLYGAVTEYLGFRADSDEWKVMALASYAEAPAADVDAFRRLVRVGADGSFTVALDHFEYYDHWDPRMFSDRFVETFGPPRGRDEEVTDRHREIAAALQQVFEETMATILIRLHEHSGLDRLVLSGGCAMNSVFNGRVTELTPFREVFVSSCPDDSGTSVGAALHVEAERTGCRPRPDGSHSFWAPGFTDAECLSVAEDLKLPNATVVDDPARAAAEDLVAGLLVGWFQGPGEFGQRALGHRSILVDPRSPEAKDTVNAAVKYRESFRPFAPAILAEAVADWFECPPGTRVPFMEKVLAFRPERRAEVPAVVHVDGTGRLQTVDTDNERFHALIGHFRDKTGVPLVLNTSFNLNGEPIVLTPRDAVRTFYSCGLDVLYLGNVRVQK